MNDIPIQLAVEDSLSESMLRVLLRQSGRKYCVGNCFQRSGFGYLKKTISGFNQAAKGMPFLVSTDLDEYPCPSALLSDWLHVPKHPNLLFRIAVHEVESWILADRDGFAKFFGISKKLVPANSDNVLKAKELLIDLVKQSRKRHLRQDIVPPDGSTRKQGPNYNGRLMLFIESEWVSARAIKNSPSLNRTINVIRTFSPTWADDDNIV